jgi:hypothetical protein
MGLLFPQNDLFVDADGILPIAYPVELKRRSKRQKI